LGDRNKALMAREKPSKTGAAARTSFGAYVGSEDFSSIQAIYFRQRK
jgi:hypothetical protein